MLKGFEATLKAGADAQFVGVNNPHLPSDLPGEVWQPVTQPDPGLTKD